jgi:hypothetical protein
MIRQTILYYRLYYRILHAGQQTPLRRKALTRTLGALLLCGCLAGCGSSYVSSSTPNIAGNWQFTFKSSANGNTFTGTASLTQSSTPVTSQGAGGLERAISGTMNFANDPCATSAPLSGTISGLNVILSATESGQPVSFTGTVNPAVTAMSGDYSAPGGGCTAGDFGSWTASKP